MIRFAAFGVLFGFVLSRVGATDFDAIAKMFLLSDLHLAGVIAVAVLVAGPALWLLRRRGVAGPAGPIKLAPKPRKPGNLVGGAIFGAGWALTGTCPGTVLAQLGDGHLLAIFTLLGVVGGTALYRYSGKRVERWLAREPAAAAAATTTEASATMAATAPTV